MRHVGSNLSLRPEGALDGKRTGRCPDHRAQRSRQGAEEFMAQGVEIFMPIDNYLQYWLSGNSKGLSVWEPLVRPSGFESVIDVNRSKKKNTLSFSVKKQIRTWKTRFIAMNNKLLNKNGSKI